MSGNVCEHCTAVCCEYVALPIETPKTAGGFDDVRWYLVHESVFVFVEDDDWYIAFHTPCRHRLADHRCGIYHTRPRICRQYGADQCDYHSGDYGWQQHFTVPEHLEAYLREHPPARGRRGKRRGAPKPRARVAKLTLPTQQVDRHGVPLPPLP